MRVSTRRMTSSYEQAALAHCKDSNEKQSAGKRDMRPAGRQVASRGTVVRHTRRYTSLADVDEDHSENRRPDRGLSRAPVPVQSCRTKKGSCLRVGTLKERLGRAARSRITTLTSHGCAESEGHRWKDQRTRWRSPEDLWRLYQVISRRANEWSVFDCDPRAQDPKLTVGSALCKFYQNGQCKFGDECKFQHVSKGNETVRNRRGRGKGNTKRSDDTTRFLGAAKC